MNDSSRECGVCLGTFSKRDYEHNFETLVCGHRLCYDCFEKIIEISKKDTCPFCRRPFYPMKTCETAGSIELEDVSEEWNAYIIDNMTNIINRCRRGEKRRKNHKRTRRGCFRKYITPSILEELYLLQ